MKLSIYLATLMSVAPIIAMDTPSKPTKYIIRGHQAPAPAQPVPLQQEHGSAQRQLFVEPQLLYVYDATTATYRLTPQDQLFVYDQTRRIYSLAPQVFIYDHAIQTIRLMTNQERYDLTRNQRRNQ